KGNPCLSKSSTEGEKFSLPANQGFTVCWSEEGTSARWLAMRERTWLDMTSRAKRSSPEGPRRNGTRAKTTIATAAIGAAMVSHHLGSTRGPASALAALRSDNGILLWRSTGALK